MTIEEIQAQGRSIANDPKYAPVVVGLITLGLYTVVRNPTKTISLIGGYFLLRNFNKEIADYMTKLN